MIKHLFKKQYISCSNICYKMELLGWINLANENHFGYPVTLTLINKVYKIYKCKGYLEHFKMQNMMVYFIELL